MTNKIKRYRSSLIVLLTILLALLLFVNPVVAADIPGSEVDDPDDNKWSLCPIEEANGGYNYQDGAHEMFQILFLVFAGLGVLFATLGYVVLSLIESASMSGGRGDKSQQKRRVVKAGFSIPIAIVLFDTVINNIIEIDIGCYFPDTI